MRLLAHVNLLTFVGIFGLNMYDGYPIKNLPTGGSLLQPRVKESHANDGKSSWQEHSSLRTVPNVKTLRNTTSSGEIGTSVKSHEKAKATRDALSNEFLDIRDDTQVEELVTIDNSSFNGNFSSEKNSPFPPTTSQEGSSNDSEESVVSSRNETDHFRWTDLGWADLALVTLFSSIIAGTVVGNMLVIAAVVTTRRLRTVTNCFVMSLAVADWLVGMFVMPPKVFLYLVDNEWRLGRIFCELWISLDILLCTASILSLCAISIDRYLAITRPLAYSRRRRSKRLALSMIACVWIAAVVITSPPIFGWYEENRNTDNKCEYNENTGYVVYSALGSFFLPLLVMLYVYARIACVITRRQRSIQKLHTRGDRKSQYCGSDAEEPLHQKDRDDEGGRGESGEKQSHQTATRLPSSNLLAGDGGAGDCENQELPAQSASTRGGHNNKCNDKQSAISPIRNAPPENNSFLGRFRLSSCTASSNDADGSPKCRKRTGDNTSRQDKHSGNIHDKAGNPASSAAMALSLPDPATLASGSGTENSSSSTTEHDSSCSCSQAINVSQLQQQSHRSSNCCNTHNHRLRHHHHYVSRMKTGSRLCHHSISTASPQKNMHRLHQTSSSSGRSFGDDDMHPRSDVSCGSLDRSPRVWTVEATSSPSSGKRKGREGKVNNAKCKSCSYEQELTESGNSAPDKSPSQMESVMMMECSPAGNPASLMSAASASGNTANISPSPHDKGSSYSTRIQSRIYQPQNHHRVIQNHSLESGHPSSGTQRTRSMKFVPHLHGNDQNHNGGTASREFTSGRIASFKRETKTAQTLAAVVGGFIICWLPFFVAYVMGPFIPSSDAIPSALMDALIWLGWSNSAINPFIYAFYSADFRSAFWRLTVHKCEALFRTHNQARNSPRRYEDPPHHHRIST